MNLLFSPYAVSCGMKLVERRATRLPLLKLPPSNISASLREETYLLFGPKA